MLPKQTVSDVSNRHLFKSRLLEYTQKAALSKPVYNTIQEGPPHEPVFHSTVVLNNIRYESLSKFANRKAAEHSAAEAALKELAKAGQRGQSISVPVHETGLCKSRLQEYAQKMHYAIPVYRCESREKEGRIPFYTCSVEVGGVKFIGAGAKRKRDAEINAAITALSSIHAAASKSSDTPFESSQLTVVPYKKRAPERTNDIEEIARVPKAKVNHIGGGVTPHMDTLANALQIVIQSVQMVLESSKEQSGSEPGQCATDGVARRARNASC